MAYLSTVASSNLGYQNFFSAKLTSSLTASDTDIPMDAVPSVSEGVLVVDWDVSASREVIFFNSKTASKVVCPSAANGRGFDGSTATTHASGANVIMAPVADYFRYIQYIATTSTAAWKPLGYVPDTITDNGNRSYTMVFNSVDLTSFISNGMKLKGTPTTAQPTQCTSLNGTNQYYTKTSPSGVTFTVTWTTGSWVKPSVHQIGYIITRETAATGWALRLSAAGLIENYGWNASNGKLTTSYQSVPLNKWSHVAASMDMTSGGLLYLDGTLIPSTTTNLGAGAVAIAQSGTLQVGASTTPSAYFAGKLAQTFVASSVISAANIRIIKNQGLTAALCTTYNIISAYSFNNAITDINTGNANNLSAQNSAVATNADSPFGLNDAGTPDTNEWGVVTSRTFSTNTTLTVQVPEGSAWPTSPASSAISAMSYSTEKAPYKFPTAAGRWYVECQYYANVASAALTANTWKTITGANITVPIGSWDIGYEGCAYISGGSITIDPHLGLGTTVDAMPDRRTEQGFYTGAATTAFKYAINRYADITLTSATVYYVNVLAVTVSGTTMGIDASSGICIVRAKFALL